MRYCLGVALLLLVLVGAQHVVPWAWHAMPLRFSTHSDGIQLRARVEGYMLHAWLEYGGEVLDPAEWDEGLAVTVELSSGRVIQLQPHDFLFRGVLPFRSNASIVRVTARGTHNGEEIEITGKLEKRLYFSR